MFLKRKWKAINIITDNGIKKIELDQNEKLPKDLFPRTRKCRSTDYINTLGKCSCLVMNSITKSSMSKRLINADTSNQIIQSLTQNKQTQSKDGLNGSNEKEEHEIAIPKQNSDKINKSLLSDPIFNIEMPNSNSIYEIFQSDMSFTSNNSDDDFFNFTF